MTEFDLIEIARRFRVLEGLLEHADLILLARETFLTKRDFVQEAEKVAGLRGDIDGASDACRIDMTAMQEVIRRGA